MVNRVVPRDELDTTVELIAQQIAQAPLSVLMGIKAGVKRAWEGMGMRVHLQSHLQVMEAVGAAGDVGGLESRRTAAKGYGLSPRRSPPSEPRQPAKPQRPGPAPRRTWDERQRSRNTRDGPTPPSALRALGTARIAPVALIDPARCLDVDVVVVASRDPERAAAFAAVERHRRVLRRKAEPNTRHP